MNRFKKFLSMMLVVGVLLSTASAVLPEFPAGIPVKRTHLQEMQKLERGFLSNLAIFAGVAAAAVAENSQAEAIRLAGELANKLRVYSGQTQLQEIFVGSEILAYQQALDVFATSPTIENARFFIPDIVPQQSESCGFRSLISSARTVTFIFAGGVLAATLVLCGPAVVAAEVASWIPAVQIHFGVATVAHAKAAILAAAATVGAAAAGTAAVITDGSAGQAKQSGARRQRE